MTYDDWKTTDDTPLPPPCEECGRECNWPAGCHCCEACEPPPFCMTCNWRHFGGCEDDAEGSVSQGDAVGDEPVGDGRGEVR